MGTNSTRYSYETDSMYEARQIVDSINNPQPTQSYLQILSSYMGSLTTYILSLSKITMVLLLICMSLYGFTKKNSQILDNTLSSLYSDWGDEYEEHIFYTILAMMVTILFRALFPKLIWITDFLFITMVYIFVLQTIETRFEKLYVLKCYEWKKPWFCYWIKIYKFINYYMNELIIYGVFVIIIININIKCLIK